MANEHGTDPGGTRRDDAVERTAAEARRAAGGAVEQTSRQAADQAERVARSFDEAASTLEDEGSPELSRYMSTLAGGIGQLADRMRNTSADELFRDVNTFARRNPALFLAGSVALGFVATRFARASRSPRGDASDSSSRYGASSGDGAQRSAGDSGAVGGTSARGSAGMTGASGTSGSAGSTGGTADTSAAFGTSRTADTAGKPATRAAGADRASVGVDGLRTTPSSGVGQAGAPEHSGRSSLGTSGRGVQSDSGTQQEPRDEWKKP